MIELPAGAVGPVSASWPVLLLLAGVAVFAGAVVQGAAGFGPALVAAPVVMLLDPSVMPGAVQVVALVLPLCSLAAEWRHVDWRGVGRALLGRVPGAVVGVWVVKAASPQALAVIVGVMVLVAVVLTARTVTVPRTPRTLAVAGAVSGVTGTATSIGGPPIALVHRHATGPRIRATLAMYFVVGAVLSLGALAAGGECRRGRCSPGCCSCRSRSPGTRRPDRCAGTSTATAPGSPCWSWRPSPRPCRSSGRWG
ncbi:hypothetical protein GCM10010106_25800 [Thermopolyspora flexuosa]|uniref:Probable membrane transporter protein n=1 Tax=Thermopolyspora flexuosa TaxID=103836 RepID=A0A543IVV7_9ACTN|nr:sulfite exporter TauE/SafE family protein [Thermopolyspora flexuosa]TQM74687.1 hypothetical protein FHX40_1369 [Thermopolyspora flexuosa]GGM78102.1 hypothetical protein GCM10010106_25800 [Thermopolyspora flexuosa]